MYKYNYRNIILNNDFVKKISHTWRMVVLATNYGR